MTFAILKTIMPKDCGECLFCKENRKCAIAECEMYSQNDVYDHYYKCTKPEWCPLVPIPARRETLINWYAIGGDNIPTHEPSQYDMGWNDCVDFLESEE